MRKCHYSSHCCHQWVPHAAWFSSRAVEQLGWQVLSTEEMHLEFCDILLPQFCPAASGASSQVTYWLYIHAGWLWLCSVFWTEYFCWNPTPGGSSSLLKTLMLHLCQELSLEEREEAVWTAVLAIKMSLWPASLPLGRLVLLVSLQRNLGNGIFSDLRRWVTMTANFSDNTRAFQRLSESRTKDGK